MEAGLIAVLMLAACTSSSGAAAPPRRKHRVTTTTTTTTTSATTLSPAACAARPPPVGVAPSRQQISVEPCTSLVAGQTVKVTATGFTAGKIVAIRECATPFDDTGTTCDLPNVVTISVGADGTGSADYPAAKGPFGAAASVCAPPTQCVLSVGELLPGSAVERADPVHIDFAP